MEEIVIVFALFVRIARHIGVRRGHEKWIQIGIVAKKDVPIL